MQLSCIIKNSLFLSLNIPDTNLAGITMTQIKSINPSSNSDIIGAAASSLCLIHCLATPLLFVAHTNVSYLAASKPQWWGILDYVFLFISLIAIIWSSKNTSKKWIGRALWVSWLVLTVIIINEKLALFTLIEEAVYIPTLALVFFHLYNRKYCNCNNPRQ